MTIDLGLAVRAARRARGMSQGDIEKRTGLLRCYLSRVENHYTVPSLETLAKIAHALQMRLSDFFEESPVTTRTSPAFSEQELYILTQIRQHVASLSEADKQGILTMVKRLADAPS